MYVMGAFSPNLWHIYSKVLEKNSVYTVFSTIRSFKHLLGVWEHIPGG